MIGPSLVRRVALALGGTLVAALLIVRYVARPWIVAGDSMAPTLVDGDRVVVERWAYRWRAPRPGEIALLRGPGGSAIVKRVARAAIPADLRGGRTPFEGEDPFDGAWVVLGDNPDRSADSRAFGPVPRGRFVGRVIFRYWPPSSAGAIR